MNDDAPASRADLKALKEELHTQFKEVREYVDERTGNSEKRLIGYIDERTGNSERRLIEYLDERTREMQTELLRGFRTYQESLSIRLAKVTADTGNIDTATDKRMTNIEERLSEIERRLPPPTRH